MTTETHDSLQRDMRLQAQDAILRCFADMFRLRVAAQSDVQRSTTLLLMHSGLADALKIHETQSYHSPPTELSSLRATFFLSAFGEIADTMMHIVDSGLNEAENAVLQNEPDRDGLPPQH
ncbi:MAG: hypothetical protein H7172_09570 [Ferruginibacter sp.]|nr:hypothetical protein [Rhodoferax sp.]